MIPFPNKKYSVIYPIRRGVIRTKDAAGTLIYIFQWIKLNRSGKGYFFGLGRWTRGNSECCLIATKGKPHRENNSVGQLIFEPLRKHSQKPDIVRDKIRDLMGANQTCIELFARTQTPGWDVWGNEITKFD